MDIEEIKQKAKSIIRKSNSKAVKAYLLENLEREPNETELNRTCGAPIGVNDENWPLFEGEKMAHAITIDLDSVPALKVNFSQDIKAIAVFVSDLIENEAYEPRNSESAVVFLTASDIAKGIGECVPTEHESESTAFKAHEVDLPEEVFSEEIHDLDESDPIYELSEELSQFSMAGGKPIWIQGAEHEGEIILQFDEDLVDMILGDAGVMYVFKETAFWQCS